MRTSWATQQDLVLIQQEVVFGIHLLTDPVKHVLSNIVNTTSLFVYLSPLLKDKKSIYNLIHKPNESYIQITFSIMPSAFTKTVLFLPEFPSTAVMDDYNT